MVLQGRYFLILRITPIRSRGGGGHSPFFGEYVLRGFPKVGSGEWVFLEKLEVLGGKNSEILPLES